MRAILACPPSSGHDHNAREQHLPVTAQGVCQQLVDLSGEPPARSISIDNSRDGIEQVSLAAVELPISLNADGRSISQRIKAYYERCSEAGESVSVVHPAKADAPTHFNS